MLTKRERRRTANKIGQQAMREAYGRGSEPGYFMSVMPVANALADLWHDEVMALHEQIANLIEGGGLVAAAEQAGAGEGEQ